MQRFLYHLILLSLTAACNSPKPEAMNTSSPGYTFLVGTYTDNASQGINLVEFIPERQSLTAETIFEGVNNPSRRRCQYQRGKFNGLWACWKNANSN